MEPPKSYVGKEISNKCVLIFFTKGGYSLLQVVGAATKKARSPVLIVVLRTRRCLETDDLRVLIDIRQL